MKGMTKPCPKYFPANVTTDTKPNSHLGWHKVGESSFTALTISNVYINYPVRDKGVLSLKAYAWVARVKEYFPNWLGTAEFHSDGGVVINVEPKFLAATLMFFRYSGWFRCVELTDAWCTDYPSRENRFEVTYTLLSTKKNTRVYIKSFVNDYSLLPSAACIFPAATWLEREAWDMFGITFAGHIDLRRILTDYGFFGHPLRRDFPLTGYSELRFDELTKRVVSERLSFIQEPRFFFFSTPWRKK